MSDHYRENRAIKKQAKRKRGQPTVQCANWRLHAPHGPVGVKQGWCLGLDALEAVWKVGFKTSGCCCGHGSGRGVISLALAP